MEALLTIAVIIAIIAVLVFGMLLFPVTIYINSVRAGGRIDGIFSIQWIIFLLRYIFKNRETEILIFGHRAIRLSRKEKPKSYEDIKKPIRIKKPGKIPRISDISSLAGPLYRLFKDFIRALRIKYFDMHVTFGFREPAHTGILAGFMYSIRGSVQGNHNINFTPDFTKQILEWNLKAKFTVIPVQILLSAMRFTTNRQVLKSARKVFMA